MNMNWRNELTDKCLNCEGGKVKLSDGSYVPYPIYRDQTRVYAGSLEDLTTLGLSEEKMSSFLAYCGNDCPRAQSSINIPEEGIVAVTNFRELSYEMNLPETVSTRLEGTKLNISTYAEIAGTDTVIPSKLLSVGFELLKKVEKFNEDGDRPREVQVAESAMILAQAVDELFINQETKQILKRSK